MRLTVAFALLAVAGAAHAAAHTDIQNNKEHPPAEAAAAPNHNLLRGRPASVATKKTTATRRRRHRHRHRHRHLQTNDEPGTTKWDNNRISETNPDGLPLNPETGKPDCWPSCYSDHYDGPVDVGTVGTVDVNRAVDSSSSSSSLPANDAVEQAALQLALAEAQAVTATREAPPNNNNNNPHMVYDYSTGHTYDLSTGQKVVVEEVDHTHVSTGQEQVDVKVYVVQGLPGAGGAEAAVPGSGPLDDPTPSNNSNNNNNNGAADGGGADAALPLDDPTPPSQPTCTKARDDETCTAHSQCESGCCATLATKVKCVEPRLPIFKQYCPVTNPCRDDAASAGTLVPEEASPAQPPAQGIPTGAQDKDTDAEDAMYTVGTFTTSGPDSSNPSNPNRVVGGGAGTGNGQTQTKPAADCAKALDNWPINQFPPHDQCRSSCECKSKCCVGYGRQICIDKTANEGRWADKCI